MSHVCRGICSIHTFLVCPKSSGEHAVPHSKGFLLTLMLELHVQLKEPATRNPEPTDSANHGFILLTSINHLNFK